MDESLCPWCGIGHGLSIGTMTHYDCGSSKGSKYEMQSPMCYKITRVQQELRAWKQLVNDAERAIGMDSVASVPEARSLVERCHELRRFDALHIEACGAHQRHIDELQASLDAKDKDIDRLNQMLRETGYGQGSIDAYAAQCEKLELLQAQWDAVTKFIDRL